MGGNSHTCPCGPASRSPVTPGDGSEQGGLRLASNGPERVLRTPGLLRPDVRAKQERDSARMVLKIIWKTRKGGTLRAGPRVAEGRTE